MERMSEMIEHTEPRVYIPSRDPIEPAFTERNIPVFFGCDERFLPHALAAIASIMEHASAADNYDLFILQTGLPPEKIAKALAWMRRYPNASLRFVEIGALLERAGREFLKSSKRYSFAVYFRLFAPEIFIRYGKMLYLDSDMLVMSDLAEYFRTDLDGCLLASTHDFVSEQESLANPLNARHWRDQLGKEPGEDYFVSCGLLMDFDRMREEGIPKALVEKIRSIESSDLPDQDILNAVLRNRVKYVDVAWNYFDWMLDPDEESLKFGRISEAGRDAIRRSRNNCKILHYGDKKPWDYDYNGKNEAEYWKYAAMTPFYMEVAERLDAECATVPAIGRYAFATVQIWHFRLRLAFAPASEKRKYIERIHNIDQVRKCAVRHLRRRGAVAHSRREPENS